tara:strand:- start:14124 stop:14528 length:405 start_codon:yes stop_codon:yes gene_type:complete
MAAITNITSRTLWKRVLGYRYFGPADHTADYQILASQSGGTYTNRGAGGAIQFTLPGAAKGAIFRFVVCAAQELRIHPHTDTGTIELTVGGTYAAQAAGKYVTANAAGERVALQCKGGDDWMAIDEVGTWTAES